MILTTKLGCCMRIFKTGWFRKFARKENISARDLKDLRAAASMTLNFSEAEMAKLVDTGKLEEVNCDESI